jgi:hypothetical protein
MTPFHSLLPELAQREVRCVHLGGAPDTASEPALPADEYAYLEFYCDDLKCDCRRVFLQVIAKGQGLRQHQLRVGKGVFLPEADAVGSRCGQRNGSW